MSSTIDVSIIVPTYNESENISILLTRLVATMSAFEFEIIVVDDDSPDKTWDVAGRFAATDGRVIVVRRIGARGLSTAVVSGMHVARGRAYVVIDGDLQHDERAIPALVAPLLDGNADVSVGSREAEGGSYGDFSPWRRFVSWGGATVARRVVAAPVSDPMSGFFAISADRFSEVADEINPRGFKILLEFLARGPRPRVAEVGYEFSDRVNGTTKLTKSVVGAYILALLDLALGRFVSSSFVAFAMVGIVGTVVRLGAEVVLRPISDRTALAIAFAISVVFNFWMNNRFTFASARYTGKKWAVGLSRFTVVSLHGVLVQIGVLAALDKVSPIHDRWTTPWFAEHSLALLVGLASNYSINVAYTWRPGRRLS